MPPKVSVSVVTFNHAAFLDEMFASVLSQKVDFPYEIVVSDDASTDQTATIIDRYAKQYPQIVVPIYHKTRRGPCKNIQSVVHRCQGQYIAHLDGDDCMLPGKMQKQADILDRHPELVMVVHDLDVIDESHQSIGRLKTLRRISTIRDLVRHGTYFGNSSKMYRRSATPPPELLEETRDWFFHIYNALYGDIGFIPEVLGIYRKHPGGLTHNFKLGDYQRDLNFTLRYCRETLLPKGLITTRDLAYAESRIRYFLSEVCFSAGDIRQGREFLHSSLKFFPFYSLNPYLALLKWAYPPHSLRLYNALRRFWRYQREGLRSLFLIPETRGLDLDAPEAVAVHRDLIRKKGFLRQVYVMFYGEFRRQADLLRDVPGNMLELGSGGGFLKELMPEVITSDVAAYPTVDRVAFADRLPFADGALKAIFLNNVLHHIPEPEAFFREAERCLTPGGRVVMIEPYNSRFGRMMYKRFHHEPFDETVREWRVASPGRLTGSNQALPWVIFWRDRALFETRHPSLEILDTRPHTALGYALSGGLSWRSPLPGALFPAVRWLDAQLSRFPNTFPLFQTIVLRRR